jgi:hypothetical protein
MYPGGSVRQTYSYSVLNPLDGSKIPALAGRYDYPIPTRFLAPVDCSKFQHSKYTGSSVLPPEVQSCLVFFWDAQSCGGGFRRTFLVS